MVVWWSWLRVQPCMDGTMNGVDSGDGRREIRPNACLKLAITCGVLCWAKEGGLRSSHAPDFFVLCGKL